MFFFLFLTFYWDSVFYPFWNSIKTLSTHYATYGDCGCSFRKALKRKRQIVWQLETLREGGKTLHKLLRGHVEISCPLNILKKYLFIYLESLYGLPLTLGDSERLTNFSFCQLSLNSLGWFRDIANGTCASPWPSGSVLLRIKCLFKGASFNRSISFPKWTCWRQKSILDRQYLQKRGRGREGGKKAIRGSNYSARTFRLRNIYTLQLLITNYTHPLPPVSIAGDFGVVAMKYT